MIIKLIGGIKDGEVMAIPDHKNRITIPILTMSEPTLIPYPFVPIPLFDQQYDIIKEGEQPYRAILVDNA